MWKQKKSSITYMMDSLPHLPYKDKTAYIIHGEKVRN